MTKTLPPFDKYYYYLESVQSPPDDANFLEQAYKEANGKKEPVTLREDFCAAFALCCEWVGRGLNRQAVGIDVDPEPLAYGAERYLPTLTANAQKRVRIVKQDVLTGRLPRADIIAALNFSYFLFKQRADLLRYFTNCHRSLAADGIFVLDCFGGPACHEPNESESAFDDFSYYWDQDSYNPITCEALFHIHFKRRGEKKRLKVFTYDWRLWGIPELRDILRDAGFGEVHTYWEGTTKDGEGNGVFKRSNVGEDDCEAWVAYIVAHKDR